MDNEKNEKYDLSSIVANIEKVKEMKAAKQKKPSTSIRPLKFEESPEDSPLKSEIIKRINEKNLTYSDIYAYCTALKGGDIAEGQKLGYNIISGLKNRHTFIDTTLTLLADFLKLDILFVDRKETEEEDEYDEN
jgi:hypothetical protein